MVLSSRYFCSQRTMSASSARIRSSRSRSRSWRELTVTPGGWDCLCGWKITEYVRKHCHYTGESCFVVFFTCQVRFFLPAVPSNSSAPALAASSASFPGSPSSRRWTGAGPERSGASPLSPRKPSSASTHPQAGDHGPVPPPEHPRAASPWRFAPRQRLAGVATPARPDPAQCSAPHLRGKKGREKAAALI